MSTIKVTKIESPDTASGGLKVDASGRLLHAVSTSYANAAADDLQIGDNTESTERGITIGSTAGGGIRFADAGSTKGGAIEYQHSSNHLRFYTDATERVQITSNGTIKLISSGGIDFSGIQTNNAGMTSETLDSYEEGTWTPTITFGGGSTGLTYNRQHGTYTKVGNIVYVKGHVSISAKGTSTGHADIRGLPFTPNGNGTAGNPSAFTPIADRGTVNAGSGYIGIALFLTSDVGNGARFYRYKFNGAGNAAVDHSNFATNSEIDVNFVYKIN